MKKSRSFPKLDKPRPRAPRPRPPALPRPGRMCLDKVPYGTGDKAATAARRLTRSIGVRHRVYPCPHCGGFHLTTH